MSNSVQSVWIPPVAAGISIIPCYYFFAAKSAQQIGDPLPRMTVLQALSKGVKSAPSPGTAVGVQMILQDKVDQYCQTYFGEGLYSKFASSGLIGIATAIPLGIYNGQTMGYTMAHSFQRLSLKQIVAISTREVFSVSALAISEPVCEAAKKTLGDNQVVKTGSAFATGMAGSFVGHFADASFTRWQGNLTVDRLSQLTLGFKYRAMGLGCFTALYQFTKENLSSPK